MTFLYIGMGFALGLCVGLAFMGYKTAQWLANGIRVIEYYEAKYNHALHEYTKVSTGREPYVKA